MTDIFESPDGGHTIYVRKANSTERVLLSEDDYAKDRKKRFEWHQIWDAKDSNPALQKAVERVIMIYRLGKDNG
ncbi:hypothetical protein EBU71_19030 [bacterium]|nr:hypothetical protein [Candidatus Elulimicrobium humile]